MNRLPNYKNTPPNVATRTDGFIHTRLTGRVECRAYGIGNAVRLGNVTLIVTDRQAGISIATAALVFEDLTSRLSYAYPHRFTDKPRQTNDLTALVTLRRAQQVGNLEVRPGSGGCGEASLTLGNVRITVCDRDAAERVAKALADAYSEAVHTFVRLRPLEELRAARDHRRAANKARRRGIRL